METLFRKGRCRAWGRKSLMLFFCFMCRPVHKVRILAPGSLPLKRCRGGAASRDKISPTCLPVSGSSEALRQIASVRIYKFRNPACSDSLYPILLFREPLEHFLARQIVPDINFQFEESSIDGKRIVVLTIPAARTVPTAFGGNRFIRIGSSKVNLNKYPERESKLFDILRNGLPTVENVESDIQDLTFRKLFLYYEDKGIVLNKNTFKKNLRLLTKEGKYNLLAQLLSDNSQIPVRVSIFQGRDKASPLYSVREFGNSCILISLDKVLEYGDVINIMQADETDRVVERKEVPLFSVCFLSL